MKDSCIQTNFSRPYFRRRYNPGHNSRYLQCATARNQQQRITPQPQTMKSMQKNLISYHLHLILLES